MPRSRDNVVRNPVLAGRAAPIRIALDGHAVATAFPDCVGGFERVIRGDGRQLWLKSDVHRFAERVTSIASQTEKVSFVKP